MAFEVRHSGLPILVVGFIRIDKTLEILNLLKERGRRVYVYLDRATGTNSQINGLLHSQILSYKDSMQIEVYWAQEPMGVGRGVPAAIDWVLSREEAVIILEDDCLPSWSSFDYFDYQIQNVTGQIKMVSGTAPSMEFLGVPRISSYPLIWGWSTTAHAWGQLRVGINCQIPLRRVMLGILRRPSKVISISFFYAAYLRVRSGRLAAWDSPMALLILIENWSCIIPPFTLIRNSGRDIYGHHMSEYGGDSKEVLSDYLDNPVPNQLDSSSSARQLVDRVIEDHVYAIQFRHLLAPIKAILRF